MRLWRHKHGSDSADDVSAEAEPAEEPAVVQLDHITADLARARAAAETEAEEQARPAGAGRPEPAPS